MVYVDQVMSPTEGNPRLFSMYGEGWILIPFGWILNNYLLDNLVIEEPLQALRDGKASFQRIAEIIDEVNIAQDESYDVVRYQYEYLAINPKEGLTIGIPVKHPLCADASQFQPRTRSLVVERPIKGRLLKTVLPLMPPYVFYGLMSSHPYPMDRSPESMGYIEELYYNKSNLDFFKRKYPVRLKSLTPLSSEKGRVTVAPRAEKARIASHPVGSVASGPRKPGTSRSLW